MTVTVKIKEPFSRFAENGKEEFFEAGQEVSVPAEDADSWEAKGLAKRTTKSTPAPAAGKGSDSLSS